MAEIHPELFRRFRGYLFPGEYQHQVRLGVRFWGEDGEECGQNPVDQLILDRGRLKRVRVMNDVVDEPTHNLVHRIVARIFGMRHVPTALHDLFQHVARDFHQCVEFIRGQPQHISDYVLDGATRDLGILMEEEPSRQLFEKFFGQKIADARVYRAQERLDVMRDLPFPDLARTREFVDRVQGELHEIGHVLVRGQFYQREQLVREQVLVLGGEHGDQRSEVGPRYGLGIIAEQFHTLGEQDLPHGVILLDLPLRLKEVD